VVLALISALPEAIMMSSFDVAIPFGFVSQELLVNVYLTGVGGEPTTNILSKNEMSLS
jgi:hypothetical protein